MRAFSGTRTSVVVFLVVSFLFFFFFFFDTLQQSRMRRKKKKNTMHTSVFLDVLLFYRPLLVFLVSLTAAAAAEVRASLSLAAHRPPQIRDSIAKHSVLVLVYIFSDHTETGNTKMTKEKEKGREKKLVRCVYIRDSFVVARNARPRTTPSAGELLLLTLQRVRPPAVQ